jgi:plastocyanin
VFKDPFPQVYTEELLMRNKCIAMVLAAGVFMAACGGGDDGGGPPAGTNLIAKESGDNQTGTVNVQLTSDFCAKVTQSGTAVDGIAVNWTTPNGGTLTPPSSSTGANGLACSRLTLGTAAGPQTAQAAVTGATGSPVTFNATANPGSATTLVKAGGDLQSGDINTDLAEDLSVRVTDTFGNGIGGALVTWLLSSGSATLTPPSGNTNSTGLATTTVTVGAAGPIIITASSAGLTGSPQTFNATGTTPPPPPSAITITVQNNQFVPDVDTVAAGGTVTWTWSNTVGVTHSVTSTGTTSFTSDPSGAIASPHSYGPVTFNTPGTYFYYCIIHGTAGNPPTGMSGTIVVQ